MLFLSFRFKNNLWLCWVHCSFLISLTALTYIFVSQIFISTDICSSFYNVLIKLNKLVYILAEFVPYEKRPKYLFIGKNTTLNRFSKKIRREKQRLASLKVDDKTHLKRTSSRLSKLHKKIERLQELGIKTTYTPENLAVIKQEDRHPSLNQIYPVENTTEGTKVSRKKSSKSIEKIKSVVSLPENTKRKSTAVSKSKSLTAVKSSNKIGGGDQTTKVDVATSPSVKKNKKQKSKLTNGGIGKKSKQLAPLNSETVRKIARELIRKRGDSLLTYPVNVKDKLKKKSLKK